MNYLKIKIIFLITVIVSLSIATFSLLFYLFEIKNYDVVDEQISEIIATGFTVELPNIINDSMEFDNGQQVNTEAIVPEPELVLNTSFTNDDNEVEVKNIAILTEGIKPEPLRVVETIITNKATLSEDKDLSEENEGNVLSEEDIFLLYNPTLKELEEQATHSLNLLLMRAHDEYKELKANDEEVSFSYFYTKYMTAVKELEVQADDAFYIIVDALQQELHTHGYHTEAVATIVADYEELKKTRQLQIFKKVLNYF